MWGDNIWRLITGILTVALLSSACTGPSEGPSTIDVPRAAVASTDAGASSDDFTRFAAELDYLRDQLAIPGMSAAVVRDQELVWAEGFGFADLDNQNPATPDTPYHLASVTKPIAATIIMQLVEEGTITLDDPVADYGVDLPAAVKVRHLLTHTSSGAPGTIYRYDGSRYGELSKVIEVATGQTFRTAMRDRILEPLGMTDTAGNTPECGEDITADTLTLGRNVRATLARPYQLDMAFQVVGSAYPLSYSPAAGLISSVVDLAAFDAALDYNLLLKEETRAEMMTPVTATSSGTTDQMYGLGWFIQDYEGTRLIWHHGHWPPSVSALYLKVPDLGLSFMVLGNTPNLSRPFPLGDGDVLTSALAVAFYREFVFPRLNDTPLPDIDWESDEATLAAQLSGIEDDEVSRFLEKELWSHRMMFHSVGRADLVRRLGNVHAAAYADPATMTTHLAPAPQAPLEPEVQVDGSLLRLLSGDYVVNEAASRWPAGEVIDGHISLTVEEGRIVACGQDGAPLIMVPVGPTRFRSAPMGGAPVYADVRLNGETVLDITLQIADLATLVLEPAETSRSAVALGIVEPEAVGWSSSRLEEAAAFAEEIGSAAVLATRGRDIFFSWGETRTKFPVHSIRKPFLGAVFGKHVAAGDIDLDATLQELGIDDIPPSLTADEKQATVRDLLASRSGVYHEAAAEHPLMIEARPKRGSHPPDTYYYYNNWDFNVLATIFEQETGLGVCEAFKTEIADVIGMEDFSAGDCSYQHEPEKSMHPAYPIAMTARDMARFGLLYTHKGRWAGKQVVPEQWIEESWTQYSLVDAAAGVGRGYLWDIASTDGEFGRAVGHEMYFHTGVGVHVLAVIPELDLVLVHRMDTTGPFTDPGEKLGELLGMVILARD
jgi:CubicO group peptidase (beta-lactamase class C family)